MVSVNEPEHRAPVARASPSVTWSTNLLPGIIQRIYVDIRMYIPDTVKLNISVSTTTSIDEGRLIACLGQQSHFESIMTKYPGCSSSPTISDRGGFLLGDVAGDQRAAAPRLQQYRGR